ncbi:capsid assembly scaffolding protein Gp46 family protein [Gordonia sp. (in: high G+C Gram-positive bacteria)]|uniref:capsid assembly scaffolding protein Gp46 family protein n=1 Tax=Gordonia sp. (in: high G+C Gram-positive bacteria) TaxID=84139 RepID=UPI003F998607
MTKQQMRLRFIEGGEGGDGGGGTPPADPKPTDPPEGDGDEPLGEAGKKALAAERATVKDLRAQIKALEDAAKATPEPKPEPKTEGDDVADQLAELKKQLDDEKAARTAAETAALRSRLGAKLPAELLDLLTGTTEEEITAQVETLAQHIKTGPTPNPQQGQAPGNTGGSIAAGRDRYKAAHS